MNRLGRGLLLALVAWWSGSAAAEGLTLAVSKGPVSLLVYMAEAEGLFAKEGLDVRSVGCSSGRECMQLMAEGKSDLATAADMAVVLTAAQRRDVAIVATISTSSHQIKLIARRSAGITEPVQIAGKRIGTAVGTSAQYFLDHWLLFENIDSGRLQTVALAPAQLPDALARHEVDAVAIWEPLAGTALAALKGDATVLPNPRVYTQHFNLAATEGLLGKRREDIARLLRALVQAEDAIRRKPEVARDVLMRQVGLDAASAAQALKDHDFRLRLDQALVSTMSSQMRWAVQQQHVKAGALPASPLALIQAGPLSDSAPAAVSVVDPQGRPWRGLP